MPPPGIRCPHCRSRNTRETFYNQLRCLDCNEISDFVPTWMPVYWLRERIIPIAAIIFIPLAIIAFLSEYIINWEDYNINAHLSVQKKPDRTAPVREQLNQPIWLTDYTSNANVLNNISWHYGNLGPCGPPSDLPTHYGAVTEGLYVDNSMICIRHQMARKVPTCTALHELAHAIDYTQRGYTDHTPYFNKILLSLHTHPASRKWNVSCTRDH